MLRTHRNDIATLVQRAGLPVTEFEWRQTEYEDEGTEVLVHRPTESRYHFWVDDNGLQHGVADPGPNGGQARRRPGTWAQQLEYVWQWLAMVKAEHDAPDLWGQAIATAREAPLPPVRDEPLTERDRESIAQLIGGLRGYIAARADATDARVQAVSEQLDYLQASTERLSRKDWINIAIGVVMTTAASGAITPEDARSLMQMAWHGLRAIVAGAPLLPNPLG